jgi:hypothetical protein
MPIEQNTVETGWLYKTSNNQERVVLGHNSEGKVVYASRGGYIQNSFNCKHASNLARFSIACSKKVRQLTADELQKVVASCNAASTAIKGYSE